MKTRLTNLRLIHPLFFAINPILSLWSLNIAYVPFSDVRTALLTSIVVMPFLVLISWLALKNWEKGTLIVSGFLFLFFSYGYANNELKELMLIGDPNAIVKILGPLWIGLFIIWVWLVVKRIRDLMQFNAILSWIGIAILATSLVPILKYYLSPSKLAKSVESEKIRFMEGFEWEGEKQPPDIYYIILDAYGREDILLQLYEYDNSDFIDFLVEKGFYVAHQSTSNYNQTAVSISSSTNMEYINYYREMLGKHSDNRKPLVDLTKNSYVRKVLEANGYQLVNIQSGFPTTDIADAAFYLGEGEIQNTSPTEAGTTSAFEWMLVESTGFQGIFDFLVISLEMRELNASRLFENHRARILTEFDRLDDMAARPGNYLMFAHIIAPHPPFVFGPEGEMIQNTGGFTLQDGNYLIKNKEENRKKYIDLYRGQIEYISFMTKDAINRILEESENPPIIILQADHGPGAYLDWDSLDNSNMVERFSILNAYYFPDGNYDGLYPSITPVNTFRVIFNTYFGGNFDILEDKSYFSLWDTPYDFVDVTDQLNH